MEADEKHEEIQVEADKDEEARVEADEKRQWRDTGNAEEKDEEPQPEAIRVRLYMPNCGT